MIKEFKDELKKLKSILNDIENLQMTRQLEMEQAYEISKEIEELETKRIDISEVLEQNLMSSALKYRYLKKSYDIEKEEKLRNNARKMLYEIHRLETE